MRLLRKKQSLSNSDLACQKPEIPFDKQLYLLYLLSWGWASRPPLPIFQKVKLWDYKINQRHPKESRVEIPV